MSPSSKKIIGGLIALLFVVTIAQSGAIAQIAKNVNSNKTLVTLSAEDQGAQIFNTAAGGCIQVLADTRAQTHINRVDYDDNTAQFVIPFKVKNKCNYSVGFLSDRRSMYSGLETIKAISVESPYFYDGFLSNPVDYGTVINPLWLYGIGQYNVMSSFIDESNLSGISPQLQEESALRYFEIPASSQQNYYVDAYIVKDGDSNALRVSLNRFRWFKMSDYTNDNMLSSNEVKTYNVPQAIREQTATSYTDFFYDPNAQMSEQERTSLSKELNAKLISEYPIKN